MSMATALLIGGAAVGAYFVYKNMGDPLPQTDPTKPATVVPGTGQSIAPAGTVVANPIATTTLTTQQLYTMKNVNVLPMLTAAALPQTAKMTVSQWNYYLTQVYGIPGQFLGDDGTPVDAIGYRTLLAAWANKQVGLGMIISLNDIYSRMPAGSSFGDDEFFKGLAGIGLLVDAPANNAAYIDQGVFTEGASLNGSLDASTKDFYLAVGANG